MIQGSAADLIKRAMLAVDQRIRAAGLEARMVLQIHDELVFEAPDAELATLSTLVREAMTTALDLKVPVKVDLAAGPELARREEPARMHEPRDGGPGLRTVLHASQRCARPGRENPRGAVLIAVAEE